MDEMNQKDLLNSDKTEESAQTEETAASAEDAQTAEPSPEEIKAKRKKKFWKEVREWIVSLAAALLIVFLVRFFLFTIIRVDGSSMETTLHSGERL